MYSTRPPVRPHRKSSHPLALDDLKELLSNEEIQTICHQLGHTWRNRLLPPTTTVRSMLYRSLHPDKSIKAILAHVAAADDSLSSPPTDAAWCQARSRLPQGLWPKLIHRSAHRLNKQVGHQYLFLGRPLYIFDGSTVSMPDRPSLAHAFGYAPVRHGPSRFPVARFTLAVQAGTNAVCEYRLGPYDESEDTQFKALWDEIPSGAICLCDRKFSTYYNIAKLRRHRLDILAPLHQNRDPHRLIEKGKIIGRNQWIVPLQVTTQWRQHYHDRSLPRVIFVRLIRHTFRRHNKRQTLWLITTLLDPHLYPKSSLIRLYRRRWHIETRLDELKTTLQMNVLRSKTPEGVRSEVAATILAHNLTWSIIHQAAERTGIAARRISFACTLKIIVAFCILLHHASVSGRLLVYDRMLRNIAGQTNRYRPGRTEPRRIKRDPVRYPFLRIPREQARLLGLS